MQALPNTKSGLQKLASRGLNASKRAAIQTAERKERRAEVAGAFILLPIIRDFAPKLPIVGGLGLQPKLRDAVVAYAVSMWTDGDISDAAWGATLGAVGAYSYEQKALLGGLFGGNGNGNGG